VDEFRPPAVTDSEGDPEDERGFRCTTVSWDAAVSASAFSLVSQCCLAMAVHIAVLIREHSMFFYNYTYIVSI